ncbi:CHAT domain-containing protein [Mycena maculata]|uniref:CHAT domain-containing protein n=1 Tax=Mycena maculata TaxID=230809 RepID=A0AAD7JRE1_9AGAR|nr:CHAT domain-containing protein [Mycena maculata]
MPETVHLHDILVNSLSGRHKDLPADMKMSVQLIVNGHIFLEAVPVDTEPSRNHWKLKIDCKIPQHALSVLIAVMRHSESEGIRLVGWIEVRRGQALISARENTPFHLEIVKVNQDGPSLELSAGFTVSKSFSADIYNIDTLDILDNQIGHDSQIILNRLMWMFHHTSAANRLDRLEFWVMHERILFLAPQKSRAMFLSLLGKICSERWEASPMVEDFNQAVSAHQDALRDDPDCFSSSSGLSSIFRGRFEQLGDVGDINESVSVMEACISLIPDGGGERPLLLNCLAMSLYRRFERLGQLDDINRSIAVVDEAVALTPDSNHLKPAMLSQLGLLLCRRFKRFGDLSDLNKSILKGEDAIHLTRDDDPRLLGTLAISLLRHFEHFGELSSLNRSILMLKHSLCLTPPGDSTRSSGLVNLGQALLTRFHKLSDIGDLNQSVSFQEEAAHLIPDGHINKPPCLYNLGNSLLARFRQLHNHSDLDHSILVYETSVHLTPDSHPDKPSRLENLGECLCERFEQLGEISDLNKSLEMRQNALILTPEGHPDRSPRMYNVGTSFSLRFQRLGDINDLNSCIRIGDEALCLTPDDHPKRPLWLSLLGSSLLSRFERFGDLSDLNRSVVFHEDALCQTPEGDTGKPTWLSSLGASLKARFEQLGDLDDLNHSVSVFEDAIGLTPEGHPDKAGWLNNLATSLNNRFKRLGNIDDLEKSISMAEDASHLISASHPDRPTLLNNFSLLLFSRFERLGDTNDLNMSVSIEEEAIHLTPAGHPDMPARLNNLGAFLYCRFRRLGDTSDLNRSLLMGEDALAHAACSATGLPSIRFRAASMWARSARSGEHPSLLEAYRVALDILPELAWLGSSIRDRHHNLPEAGRLVRDAAAAAAASGSPDKAVEWLEQGRSIIWGQVLNLRTCKAVETLRKNHPMLADKFVFLSAQLDAAHTGGGSLAVVDTAAGQSLTRRSHDHVIEREQVLQEIRRLEGFDRFLLPKQIRELSQATQGGPVVILNITDNQCDALTLTPGPDNEVGHITLPGFTMQDAESLARSLDRLVHHPGRSERLLGKLEGQQNIEDEFAHILSELWVHMVKPVLEALGITASSTQNQRIWWCPTGPLTFLPIHAAGIYGENEVFGSKLSDFVISSYTPSLTALIRGFRPRSQSHEELRLLAVAQPSAYGQVHIPGTREEINHIQLHARGKVSVLQLEEDAATVASVQEGMKSSAWVHFACHGVQDTIDPTESALLLAGSSRLTLSSIIKVSLPHADLAFLSACQTATGDKGLQEESVHLAAGMLLAGYRGVIATMWTIMDNDGPQVASNVYEHLFKTAPPDSSRAAEASHLAVQNLRQGSDGKRKSFLDWVPFIHVGV